MSLLPYEKREPNGTPDASIIWLHGLGADGNDFMDIVPTLAGEARMKLRFIFPHAPVQPVTLNGGYRMRSWYDLTGFSLRGLEIDQAQFRVSARAIMDFIEHERRNGIPSERILLAGFSQGGSLALHVGLRYPLRLGGILALSTFMPTWDTLENERSEANKHTPIFMAHGLQDPIVPVPLGLLAAQQLNALGYTVNWHDYPMAHAMSDQEVQDIRQFIAQRLYPSATTAG